MNTISIQPFKGEYPHRIVGQPAIWEPCEVVGVLAPDGPTAWGKFAIIIEEDGQLYVDAVDSVRRAA